MIEKTTPHPTKYPDSLQNAAAPELSAVSAQQPLPGPYLESAPYSLAKTHYPSLLESGVRIYEYTPGFVHAKVFVSDDREAVVGTINLDYRSLYHHFECATYLYHTDCIPKIAADFENTLEKCRMVTAETIRNEKWSPRVMGFVLKTIAPLM